jgi:diguanylate cyclase (GGDEF)-like protein
VTILGFSDEPIGTYSVSCHDCLAPFDALEAAWCSCSGTERTLVCPSCLTCFCRAIPAYKQSFWRDAPKSLSDAKLSQHDGLTQLLTRAAFLERAAAVLARVGRHPERSVAWVMIDLDDFKSINDRYGRPTGDRLLVSLSALLRRHLRQSDTIGRIGGEEFAVLLHDLREGQALRLVRRLLDEFSSWEHAAPDGSRFTAAFSAGIAMLEPGSLDLNGWRRAAEQAVSVAKATGRRRVVASPAASSPAP